MRPHFEALFGYEIRQGGMNIHSLFQTVGERDCVPVVLFNFEVRAAPPGTAVGEATLERRPRNQSSLFG